MEQSQLPQGNMIKLKSINKIIEERYLMRSDDKKSLSLEEYFSLSQKSLSSIVPPRFKDAFISNKAIEDFMMNKFDWEKGLYIYGSCGTGKTFNLYGIRKLLAMNFKFNLEISDISQKFKSSSKVININKFFSDIKSSFGSEDSERFSNDSIEDRSIMLIDDLGIEKQTEWTNSEFHKLIDFRYLNLIPTFFSSNYSISEISERMGDRIASRIVEMCNIIKIEGNDKRLNK